MNKQSELTNGDTTTSIEEMELEADTWMERFDQHVGLIVEALNLMATQTCVMNGHLEMIESLLTRSERKTTEH